MSVENDTYTLRIETTSSLEAGMIEEKLSKLTRDYDRGEKDGDEQIRIILLGNSKDREEGKYFYYPTGEIKDDFSDEMVEVGKVLIERTGLSITKDYNYRRIYNWGYIGKYFMKELSTLFPNNKCILEERFWNSQTDTPGTSREVWLNGENLENELSWETLPNE